MGGTALGNFHHFQLKVAYLNMATLIPCPYCGYSLDDFAGTALLDLPTYPRLVCPGCNKQVPWDCDDADGDFYWWVATEDLKTEPA